MKIQAIKTGVNNGVITVIGEFLTDNKVNQVLVNNGVTEYKTVYASESAYVVEYTFEYVKQNTVGNHVNITWKDQMDAKEYVTSQKLVG